LEYNNRLNMKQENKNGKVFINKALTNKYTLSIYADFTGKPSLLEIQQEIIGLVFWCNYHPLKFYIKDDILIITDESFYGEFSANNVVDFTTAQELLTSLKSGIN